jgi:uncharacterized membrane protein
VGLLRRRWFWVFVSGLILLYLVERTLVATSNPNYVPSVILLGAFLTAVVLLHALWDTFASVKSATFFGFLSVELLSLLVALVSLVLLIRRVREARRAAEGGGGRVA